MERVLSGEILFEGKMCCSDGCCPVITVVRINGRHPQKLVQIRDDDAGVVTLTEKQFVILMRVTGIHALNTILS